VGGKRKTNGDNNYKKKKRKIKMRAEGPNIQKKYSAWELL
jgi:hypothetical protein